MRKLFLLLMMVLSLPIMANTIPGMVVTMSGGEVKEYIISNIDKITYSGGNMIITTTSGENESLSTDDIKKITLSTISATGVSDLNAQTAERLSYSLYTADGKYLGKGKITVGGSLPIKNLPGGKYIIDLNGKKIKVVK